MFSPLFIVPKSRYALNQDIVSRLEFFGITFDAHPHSGWFICLASHGARRTESHIIKKTSISQLVANRSFCHFRIRIDD